ncbi:hypothetical protein [Gluconacetobacter diazotrophicus]|uniref:Uncharacterized protein n=1 Tax=Gluconacetobacter diazotrophicus (strain ATCC 49037 / DSM 5601 / CCUG 37298 / CIP 103539 / LMG 7603 / PAl5) TaxID=272568 RepID=A9H0F5_GLUDA|nr:hypothetical protein [Gluconacetobacter diazotrophicus]CAP57118.1 hypothetical protein GDI3175 [Gluconacetobacter diazotrophicus PA1 5]
MPFPFSDWMPWWLQLTLLILGTLFAFVWLLMPFAVFGVKGRLDALALQIEDLQAELRVLAVPPEERRPAMPAAPRAAAPVAEPAPMAARPADPPPMVARAADLPAASDAYPPRPERPAASRPTRFDPPPPGPAPARAAPPVEPPPGRRTAPQRARAAGRGPADAVARPTGSTRCLGAPAARAAFLPPARTACPAAGGP